MSSVDRTICSSVNCVYAYNKNLFHNASYVKKTETLSVCLKSWWYVYFIATEIQNIQIADGDVARMLPIPIYMIFPRLFTAPTLATNNFKIGEYPLCFIVPLSAQ